MIIIYPKICSMLTVSWLATMELATSESIKPQAEPMAEIIVG